MGILRVRNPQALSNAFWKLVVYDRWAVFLLLWAIRKFKNYEYWVDPYVSSDIEDETLVLCAP